MNKRIQSAITQGFIFNLIVAFGLIAFFIFYINPALLEVGEKKNELESINEEFASMSEKGLTFQEFKSLYKEYTDSSDPYINNILKVLDVDFYNQNLENTTDKDYSDFLSLKKEEIEKKKTSPEFMNMEKQIEAILPPYSSNGRDDEAFSDHDFTNYIEALLFTFNLQTDDSIWVGAVLPHEEVNPSTSKSQRAISTDTSIFYIPLQLKLTGQKKDILDFLHYSENVWSITIQDGELMTYSDNTIRKSIEGEAPSLKYNIYQHQLSEIESITMRDYIDSSSELTSGDMVKFIKTTQWREKFTVEIALRFYVAGLPDYKAEKFIEDTFARYNELKKTITKSIAQNKKIGRDVRSSDVLFSISSINSLGTLIESIEEDATKLRQTFLKDKSKINEVYQKFLELDKQFDKAEAILEKHQATINTIQ